MKTTSDPHATHMGRVESEPTPGRYSSRPFRPY